jgi:hypothetical protein
MRTVSHQNVVALKYFFYTNGDKKDEVFLNLVLEFVPETIYKSSRHFSKLKQPMPPILIKVNYDFYGFRFPFTRFVIDLLPFCARLISYSYTCTKYSVHWLMSTLWVFVIVTLNRRTCFSTQILVSLSYAISAGTLTIDLFDPNYV